MQPHATDVKSKLFPLSENSKQEVRETNFPSSQMLIYQVNENIRTWIYDRS